MDRLGAGRSDRSPAAPVGRVFAPLALVFAAAGCGGFRSPAPTPEQPRRATSIVEPSPTKSTPETTPVVQLSNLLGQWELAFQQSGGIAGVSRRLQVTSSGKALATDSGLGREISFQLSADEQANLEAILSSICISAAGVRPPRCADCFQYWIQLEGAGGRFEFWANDAGLAGHPGAELINFLRQILDAALVE